LKKTKNEGTAPGGLTPALRQYFQAKETCPEAVLFFQMGDFYELFFDDALKVAPLLDLAITSRQKIEDKPVPMCGVPLSAGDNYINRLVAMGLKVAVCDQSSVPQSGLAERTVRRIVTPGTILAAEGGAASVPRYLASVAADGSGWALAVADISTGDVAAGCWDDLGGLTAALATLEPREILLSSDVPLPLREAATETGALLSQRDALEFSAQTGADSVREIYGTLPGPLADRPVLAGAAGALFSYVKELTRGAALTHLAAPRLLSDPGFLGLDDTAVRNLELIRSSFDGSEKASLLAQIDLTVTSMGARLLRDWLLRPLRARARIESRHDAVDILSSDLLTLSSLTKLLSDLPDLERALARLTLGRGSVRDLAAVKKTLELAPEIGLVLAQSPAEELQNLGLKTDFLPDLRNRLSFILAGDEAKDGALVAAGVSPVLDNLRELEAGGRREIAAMEASERRRTGIGNLKIGFNKVFGYYLEVTKTNLASVPKDWIRKQTISGGERYFTDELKKWEEKILTAGEKREALESRIIENLKTAVAACAPDLKTLAAALAGADALAALASCAEKRGWVRPSLTLDDVIDIKGGRHPVVEQFLSPGETFVANDVTITPRERLLIITGPNMAGKSTVLRQTALIVILNQMGSFVPATSATLSIRDQVFTRVGAADDLARGRSTFMVEMSETARILARATTRSLIILDEVGRGTSTFDGLSIAWAVCEFLHDLGGRGVPTLFATHYHELIELARHKSLTRNYNVSVKRWGESIIFLRKLTPGGVNRSYGIDVASLAGLPANVIKRAREVLSDIGRQNPGLIRKGQTRENLFTLAGLGQDGPQALAKEIAALKPEELSPLEALNLLVELKKRAGEVLC
jgi:DNA mismatch repair protein MutS